MNESLLPKEKIKQWAKKELTIHIKNPSAFQAFEKAIDNSPNIDIQLIQKALTLKLGSKTATFIQKLKAQIAPKKNLNNNSNTSIDSEHINNNKSNSDNNLDTSSVQLQNDAKMILTRDNQPNGNITVEALYIPPPPSPPHQKDQEEEDSEHEDEEEEKITIDPTLVMLAEKQEKIDKERAKKIVKTQDISYRLFVSQEYQNLEEENPSSDEEEKEMEKEFSKISRPIQAEFSSSDDEINYPSRRIDMKTAEQILKNLH